MKSRIYQILTDAPDFKVIFFGCNYIDLFFNGNSMADIFSKIMPTAIEQYEKFKRYNLISYNFMADAKMKQFVDLYPTLAQGTSESELAGKLGVSQQTISNWIARLDKELSVPVNKTDMPSV